MRKNIGENGRQIYGPAAETVQRKSPARASAAFLDTTKSEIAYRWLQRGQSTREISRSLRINDREAVESAVREVLSPSRESKVVVMRRAA